MFTVLGNGTGCQYRVKPDSGKAVKVYVNTTSGSKCVKVSSDGKSETLCPSGAANQFISSSPIDVSADSDTTSPDASTEPTGTVTDPSTTPTDAAPNKPSSDAEGKKPPAKPTAPETEASGQKSQPSQTGAQKDEQVEHSNQDEQSNDVKDALSPVILRKVRDNSGTAGSNDVIVFYLLDGVSTSNPPVLLIIGLVASLIKYSSY
ncbi:unnamed protein product [Echinostoma caproni]|uniref:Proteoglycan 4 n=1 Tax=Echinostoma caproni TaxID=27848 RepID=A0A183ALN0_9TREM|nr:unnamed protein product [Echinostoma caproni]